MSTADAWPLLSFAGGTNPTTSPPPFAVTPSHLVHLLNQCTTVRHRKQIHAQFFRTSPSQGQGQATRGGGTNNGRFSELLLTVEIVRFANGDKVDFFLAFRPANLQFWAHKRSAMGQALGCIQVDQSNVAIKENFGKFSAVLEPGCHCMPWCTGSRLAGHLTLRLQQVDVACETKTKDNVFVTVVASVQYRALSENAEDAFYKLSNTQEQIQAYVFDVIRGSVPKLRLDAVFEQKTELAKSVEHELEKAMSQYGYEIVQTLIVDIEPDEQVKRAMNEINAASRLRAAANEKAEAEKVLQIKLAEGEAGAKYLAGLGIARQHQAIVDGLRDSVVGFSSRVPGTTSRDVMDMVLVTQYFDMMKDVGSSSECSAIFIPYYPGDGNDIASRIRDGLIQVQAAESEQDQEGYAFTYRGWLSSSSDS